MKCTVKTMQLISPSPCESYSIPELRVHCGKRRRTLPAVKKQTTAALLAALADGDVKTAQLLLDSSLSVTTTDRLGRTALHLAACLPPKHSALQICQILLEKQCDVNQGDLFGMSPFVYAVSSQNLAMFSAMLPSAKVDKLDKFGNTTLHHAVATGHPNIVKTIAERTHKVNKVNILGFTPLMIASKLGHVECAKLLTQFGAVSGSIRDMHFYLTADEWARFSRRFTDNDLIELKQAEMHFKKRACTPSLLRSDHPDCQSAACEVYRTTSRTLPISVEQEVSEDKSQTQLMIKRVMLLRKLSEFFSSPGKKSHTSSTLDTKDNHKDTTPNHQAWDNRSSGIKNISVNDLLDQHLSKLTLRSSTTKQRKAPTAKLTNNLISTRSELDSAGSVDSILTRQANAIEKGSIGRKKEPAVKFAEPETTSETGRGKRPQLEPAIVTLMPGDLDHDQQAPNQSNALLPNLSQSQSAAVVTFHQSQNTTAINQSSPRVVHTSTPKLSQVHMPVPPRVPNPTPRSLRSGRSSLSSPVQKFVNFIQEQTHTGGPRSGDVVTPDQLILDRDEMLIPDCTTIDSALVKPSSGEEENEKRDPNAKPPALLCEKVKYSQQRVQSGPHRVPDNPTAPVPPSRARTSLLPHFSLAKRRKQTKRPSGKSAEENHRDLIRGFGPWVTESESERIFSLPRSRPPSIPPT